MIESREFVVFTLDDHWFALPLEVVLRVVRAVEVTPLPTEIEGIEGVINLQGRIIPILDIRKQLHRKPKPIELDDVLIIMEHKASQCALIADAVSGIMTLSLPVQSGSNGSLPGDPSLVSVVRPDGGLIFVLTGAGVFQQLERLELPLQGMKPLAVGNMV